MPFSHIARRPRARKTTSKGQSTGKKYHTLFLNIKIFSMCSFTSKNVVITNLHICTNCLEQFSTALCWKNQTRSFSDIRRMKMICGGFGAISDHKCTYILPMIIFSLFLYFAVCFPRVHACKTAAASPEASLCGLPYQRGFHMYPYGTLEPHADCCFALLVTSEHQSTLGIASNMARFKKDSGELQNLLTF